MKYSIGLYIVKVKKSKIVTIATNIVLPIPDFYLKFLFASGDKSGWENNYQRMTKTGTIKFLKKLHKWPAIVIAFFVIMFAGSGIVMNHRGAFSQVDISRKLLSRNYRYINWNLASVRGSLQVSGDTSLIYGNIGIWFTPDDFETFTDYNQCFPVGIDNRKIYSIVILRDSILVAGTHFGLYSRTIEGKQWVKTELKEEENRIADLGLKGDTLLILSRHYLFKSVDLTRFEKFQLPAFEGYIRGAGLFNTLWELHSGELWGITGKLVVDLFGIVVILLSVTGLLHFLVPGIIRRRKVRNKPVTILQKTKKKNLRWHNVVGYIFVLFLIINTTAGMFLRPPLLIPIANSRVGIIPHTHLDTPNPWNDKLRRIHWDQFLKKYIISTADGFFLAGESLQKPMAPCHVQPPVSLMGCNVFEPLDLKTYVVGSFSGLFTWNIAEGIVLDYFSGNQYNRPEGIGRPVAENMAAGLVKTSHKGNFWFDYNTGVKALPPTGRNSGESLTRNENLKNQNFPEMTDDILINSPMSLWNVALELHTGRIFEHLIGSLYLLYIPLAGLCILIVLISGFLVWWMVHRKKRKP